jgi:hypothetical protein
MCKTYCFSPATLVSWTRLAPQCHVHMYTSPLVSCYLRELASAGPTLLKGKAKFLYHRQGFGHFFLSRQPTHSHRCAPQWWTELHPSWVLSDYCKLEFRAVVIVAKHTRERKIPLRLGIPTTACHVTPHSSLSKCLGCPSINQRQNMYCTISILTVM